MDEDWNDELAEMVEDGDFEEMDARKGRRRDRSARVIELFGKRAFDYTFLNASTNRQVIIRRALRVVPFFYYMLIVRVHQVDIQAGNFNLAVFNTLPSRQDPQEFSSPASTSMSISVTSTASPGDIIIDTDSQEGPFFKIVLTATQGTGTVPIRLYAELSAVLYCRGLA